MHRFAGVLTPLAILLFAIFTSSDVTTLLIVVLHLPPDLALGAVLVLVGFVLARRAWRRWGDHLAGASALAGVVALLLGALVVPYTMVVRPLWTWIRLSLPGL